MNRAIQAMRAVVTVALAAGCASGGAQAMSSDDAITARQKLMKEEGATMKSIGDKLKAGDTSIAANAHTLVETSQRIPALFPEGSLNPKVSRAKPEIWQKWTEFQDNAKRLGDKAGQLEAMAKSGASAQAMGAAVGDIGRTTCTTCHDAFRGPEIK